MGLTHRLAQAIILNNKIDNSMEENMYYFYDATYILVIIGAIISLIASMNVKSTFNRYDTG